MKNLDFTADADARHGKRIFAAAVKIADAIDKPGKGVWTHVDVGDGTDYQFLFVRTGPLTLCVAGSTLGGGPQLITPTQRALPYVRHVFDLHQEPWTAAVTTLLFQQVLGILQIRLREEAA